MTMLQDEVSRTDESNQPHRLQATQEGSSKLLGLPREVRDIIYEWVFPRPSAPKLLRMKYFCCYEEPKHKDQKPLPLAAYRACKQMKAECPSLQRLLATGCIIPTINLYSGSLAWVRTCPSARFLDLILPFASRLRIRAANGREKRLGPSFRPPWDSLGVLAIMRAFLGGLSPFSQHDFQLSRAYQHFFQSSYNNSFKREGMQTNNGGISVTTKQGAKRKVIEFATVLRSDNVPELTYENCQDITSLLASIDDVALLRTLDTVILCPDNCKSGFELPRLNERLWRYVDEYKRDRVRPADESLGSL